MYIKVKRLKFKFIKFAGGCCLRERATYQRIRDKKQSQTILETGEWFYLYLHISKQTRVMFSMCDKRYVSQWVWWHSLM